MIKVYPNPTADFIQIMHSEPKLMEFSLFDTYGRLVQRQIIDSNGIEVDLQALPAGIYTVSVRGERVYSTKRVVKQ
ncbi:MAG: T9SS type A sorting domain-containing protein [Bacteroidota bacterium]